MLHYKDLESSPTERALEAAQVIGLSTKVAHISPPGKLNIEIEANDPNVEILESRLLFTGRATETLVGDLPASSWSLFNRCPRNDLGTPDQLFIDTYGYVQICPGIAIGNAWEQPLHTTIEEFDSERHAIVRSLVECGPSMLIRMLEIQPDREYVDPCHCCNSIRRALIDHYPDQLAPRHVYGL